MMLWKQTDNVPEIVASESFSMRNQEQLRYCFSKRRNQVLLKKSFSLLIECLKLLLTSYRTLIKMEGDEVFDSHYHGVTIPNYPWNLD